MPEASVNKHRYIVLRKKKIGSPSQIATMKSKTEAQCMSSRSNTLFRLSILGANPRHQVASFG